MKVTIRRWNIRNKTDFKLEDIARKYNSAIRKSLLSFRGFMI